MSYFLCLYHKYEDLISKRKLFMLFFSKIISSIHKNHHFALKVAKTITSTKLINSFSDQNTAILFHPTPFFLFNPLPLQKI